MIHSVDTLEIAIATTLPVANQNAPVASAMSLGVDMPSAVMMQIQPVADVPAYLSTRKPVADFADEQHLFVTLPTEMRNDIGVILKACKFAQSLVNSGLSATKACSRAYNLYRDHLTVSLSTFRNEYFDKWSRQKDWVVLVNCTKAGAGWQDRDDSLPPAFLKFCETLFGGFGRKDAKRQAILALHRQWRTGLNVDGDREPIPGYGFWQDWVKQKYPTKRFAEAPIPVGWTYSNILRQIKARGKFTKAVEDLLKEGHSAAKEHLPQHMTSRGDLRFLELVTFDDVRTDWYIFDPESGQPCELWLLVARDQATALVLGFVMHPARVRDDGSAIHLGLKEMKQLAAWLLERYPLPPYTSHWRVERGTATLPQAIADALSEMLPDRIKLHYTSMIGGRSPVGYKEKAKGNSRGKASHESHNRLFHTQTSYIAGQTGAHYAIRPADLKARAEECVEVWEMRQRLPENLRGQERYPLLLPEQARQHLFRACWEQNCRTDHKIEGFDPVLEWWNPDIGKWMPQTTWDGRTGGDVRFRKRMEMPVERAIKLMAPFAGQWTKASTDVITALLAHTIRHVTIAESGEVTLTHEGRTLKFSAPPQVSLPQLRKLLPEGQQALGYFHADDPAFLHLTNGKGSVLGTWFRRSALGFNEQDLLQQAMRYTDAALKAAQAYATELSSDRRAELDEMRAHNAELAERGNEFIDVAGPSALEAQRTTETPRPTESHIAAALTAVAKNRTVQRDTAQADADLTKAMLSED